MDERGDGDIRASFFGARVLRNFYDGVELDKGDAGDVVSTAAWSRYDENGFGSLPDVEGETDPEDGFDIDEGGLGKIIATFIASSASDNDDEGFDLDEEADGKVRVSFTWCDANGNADEGIALAELGEGELSARIRRSESTDNGGSGVKAEQEAPGEGTVVLREVLISGNAEDLPDVAGVVVIQP